MKKLLLRDWDYWSIPVCAFGLSLWGFLTILSSRSETGAPIFLANRQFLFFLLGIAAMVVAAAVPFRKHQANLLRWYLPIAAILLLLLPFLGVRVNGMCGWYDIGNYYFQPSEPAKIVYLLMLAALAAQHDGIWRKFFKMSLAAICWIVPILLQPDFGTATVYALGFAAIYYLTGGAWRCLLTAGGAAAAAAAGFLMLKPYAMRRVLGFLDPSSDPEGSGWHIRQFQLAIAHGGWSGTKLGNAFWSNSYLPLAYNDSAYAAMAETLGFAGTMPVLLLYLGLSGALFHAAQRPQLSKMARGYLIGCATMPVFQALLHIGVNVGMLPPTGLTLPLVSYGGSSLIGTWLLLGIAMSAINEPGDGFPRND